MRKVVVYISLAMIIGYSFVANAALINNGSGLVYDDDRLITWYNPAPSYHPDGSPVMMTWESATLWAKGLTIGGTAAGSWRLPSALNGDGSGPCTGYNCTGSEMGHVYYDELKNSAGGPITTTSPFTNLQPYFYWLSEEYASDTRFAWSFDLGYHYGDQSPHDKTLPQYALAVHDKDIKPVPVPATIWLLASGLVGVGFVKNRMK